MQHARRTAATAAAGRLEDRGHLREPVRLHLAANAYAQPGALPVGAVTAAVDRTVGGPALTAAWRVSDGERARRHPSELPPVVAEEAELRGAVEELDAADPERRRQPAG